MSFKTGRLSLKMKSNFFSVITKLQVSLKNWRQFLFLDRNTISSNFSEAKQKWWSSLTAFRQFGWVGRESCHGVAFAGSKPNDSKIPKRSNENSDPKPKKIGAPPLLSFSALVSQCRPVATCQNYHILLTWEKAILYFFQNRWPIL